LNKKGNTVGPRLKCCRGVIALILWAWVGTAGASAADAKYQRPPQNIRDILDAPEPPEVSVSPTGKQVLLVHSERYPPIADLAEPMLRLAGLRINPNTNGPHRPARVVRLAILAVEGGEPRDLEGPEHPRLGFPVWSPDGRAFAFTQTTPNAVELWVGDVASGKVRRIPGIVLNAAYDQPLRWMPGSGELLCKVVVADRGRPPEAPRVPSGPVIQESSGKPSPARTYQDLLQTPHDEDLFDYYTTAQLVLVDVRSDKTSPVGRPGVFATVSPAPDGEHFLVVRNHRPYSYLLPANAFPREVEIWDRRGQVVTPVASLPLADQVPIEGVPTGPRDYHWRPTEPATLVWAEALDGGDPKRKVPYRDELKVLRMGGSPTAFAKTEHRYTGLAWGEASGPVLLTDYDRDRRRRRTFLLEGDNLSAPPRLLWDRSVNDRYRDPGRPLERTLPSGHHVLWQHEGQIFLRGFGSTPGGDRPFLDRFDPKTGKAERLFRCAEEGFESVEALLSDDGVRFLLRRETKADPPNFFVRTADGNKKALTHFTDPCPPLRQIKKQLVTYQRPDGVALSFTLYLPPDYREGERRPAVLWAYPLEYTDPDTAGQVSGSPYRFTTLTGISHLFLLTQGYVVLDGATMPVVGDPEKVNDTYIDQIVASAKAAIDKADALGVIDPRRVGVGGHSYGAFMTANLLAHSDLFRAGLARSGAYNRTLTPFGFQSERRTLWEAPETYLKMSPFMYAHQIKSPLLLIHGAADNNPGTFPVQSERMYQAVKGNGGTVRFVSLPHEAHGYFARESVEQTLYEMVAWFDRYLKSNAEASR
jgi:dipeptidyl aminopeptidase/acylaminoacyl peptidase